MCVCCVCACDVKLCVCVNVNVCISNSSYLFINIFANLSTPIFTFHLSTGSVGGTYATPVLVVPQVAIGALGRLQVVPRYVNKQGAPASMEEIDE